MIFSLCQFSNAALGAIILVVSVSLPSFADDTLTKPEATANKPKMDRMDQVLVAPKDIRKAIVVIKRLKGDETLGQLHFVDAGDGVRVVGKITGLKNNAEQAIHIHEFGDCSAEDGMSAGPHYNPSGAPHGGPEGKHQHVGDLGNLKTNKLGEVEYISTFKFLSLVGPSNIAGRSVIIHADRDDLKSQPAGNAGGRIACGVIGYEK